MASTARRIMTREITPLQKLLDAANVHALPTIAGDLGGLAHLPREAPESLGVVPARVLFR